MLQVDGKHKEAGKYLIPHYNDFGKSVATLAPAGADLASPLFFFEGHLPVTQ